MDTPFSLPVVMKFGGAALFDESSFERIADIISKKSCCIVVVSAMYGETDRLTALAHNVVAHPDARELDMLLTAGERVSMSLLAMALKERGILAKSFTGSQSGIITSSEHTAAQIIDVRPFRIQSALDDGFVPIVAGFQGVSLEKEVTTLGRGGSDTTAVALGVAFGVPHVEFYKDVGAVFSKDPKTSPDALRHKALSFEQAALLAKTGAKILHPRAISLASKNGLPLHVHSLCPQCEDIGTVIGTRNGQAVSGRFEEAFCS